MLDPRLLSVNVSFEAAIVRTREMTGPLLAYRLCCAPRLVRRSGIGMAGNPF